MQQIGKSLTVSQRTPQHGSTNEGGRMISNPHQSDCVAEWLAKRSTAEVNGAIVSRLSSHGVECRVKYKTMFPSDAPSYDLAVGCDMSGGDRQAAIADLENFSTPAPKRAIEAWVLELSVLTAGKNPQGIDAEAFLSAFTGRLALYPADVARGALLGRSWKWFPSWEELERECDRLSSPRRCMIAALSKAEKAPEKVWRKPTQEERDRMQALVDEMGYGKPAEWREAAMEELIKGGLMTKGGE